VHTKLWSEILKGKNHLGVGDILKWVLEKEGVKVWTILN